MFLHTPCFWRSQSFSPKEEKLLFEVLKAHAKSAFRENVSSQVARAAAASSGSYVQAFASALLTIGGPHAPLVQACELLSAKQPHLVAQGLIANGQKVPGWGCSFSKGAPDPIWEESANALAAANPWLSDELKIITRSLEIAGKKIFPNPAAFTAACAITLGMPAKLAPSILVMGRAESWSQLMMDVL